MEDILNTLHFDQISGELQKGWQQTMEFVAAVDFNEPFILLIMALHILVLTCILLQRFARPVILLILVGVALYLEQINSWCSKNYKQFTQINYFDKNGNFIVTLVGLPVVLEIFLAIILLFWDMFCGGNSKRKSKVK
jgi:glucan phosphoethanolaminetransferase (alkaline phosphatase superfamily)